MSIRTGEAWIDRARGVFGKSIVGVFGSNGTDNLWELPLDGGPRRQLTQFTEDTIFHFDIGSDGRLAVSRGKLIRDVVLMTQR